MTHEDRLEVERLKLRLARLETKLIALQRETEEVSELRAAIARLELRIGSSGTSDAAPQLRSAAVDVRQESLRPLERTPKSAGAPRSPAAWQGAIPPPIPTPMPATTVDSPNSEAPAVAARIESMDSRPQGAPLHANDGSTDGAGEQGGSFEMRLGTYWLVRIGIVMLLTGLVFFGKYAYQSYIGKLGPGGKLTLLYLAAGGLLGAGAWIERKTTKENLKQYGQVLFGGGLAAVYFATYAAHYVPALQVIRSAVLDGVLLMLWAGVMVWIADRKRSELLAVCGIGLAYYTSAVTNIGWFTLFSNLVLTIAAVGFLARNRWVTLSKISLFATYAGYAYWRFYSGEGWSGTANSGAAPLGLSALFLLGYWIAFTGAIFLSRSERFAGAERVTFTTANNAAFFGLTLLTMMRTGQGEFWHLALGLGGVLIALVAPARGRFSEEPILAESYLTQGLLLVTLGFIGLFSGAQLALILAAQSVLLLFLGFRLENRILQIGSYAVGGLSVGIGILKMIEKPVPALVGVAVGLFLGVNAWQSMRRELRLEGSESVRPRTLYFTTLALALWFVVLWTKSTPQWLAPTMALAALVLTVSPYWTRINEAAVLGQGYLFFAQAVWLQGMADADRPPVWSSALVFGVTLSMVHWWQRQRLIPLRGLEALHLFYSVAVVALLHAWLRPSFSPDAWMAIGALLAVLFVLYGVVTRALPLVWTAQVFVVVSAAKFLSLIAGRKPDWYLALVPLIVVSGLAFVLPRWRNKLESSEFKLDERVVLIVSRGYLAIALLMLVIWTYSYLPAGYRFCTLAGLGAVVFFWTKHKPDIDRAAVAAALTAAGVGAFFVAERESSLTLANALAILLILAEQRIARKLPEHFDLKPEWHQAAIVGGSGLLWLYVSRWMWMTSAGFYLTVSWGLLALALFLAGMIFRERMYRWIGLLLLGFALGRVLLIDVWKLDQVYRIVSFMGLGIVLLVLGFIYNRYQEKIREWL